MRFTTYSKFVPGLADAVNLQALLDAAGLAGRTIDSYHVGFVLAPRVNAAGRMSSDRIRTP